VRGIGGGVITINTRTNRESKYITRMRRANGKGHKGICSARLKPCPDKGKGVASSAPTETKEAHG